MKIKVAEATKRQLDYLAAQCETNEVINIEESGLVRVGVNTPSGFEWWAPTTDWAQGGPIIERENLEIKKGNPLYFPRGNEQGDYYEDLWIAGKYHGTTPLVAAMRCYVASKLGDEVDVPEELCK